MRTVFVCAHGAGGHRDDAGMAATARALEARDIEVVRFNFPYRERGSRIPDRMPVLRACFETMVAKVRKDHTFETLVIGGRSMGARVATMMAADGFACDGLVLFAYPLHPAGRPEELRDAHLPRIRVPVICFNGTRDALCRRDLMERALQNVRAPWSMQWVEGADHTLKDAKALGEIAEAASAWVHSLRRVRSD